MTGKILLTTCASGGSENLVKWFFQGKSIPFVSLMNSSLKWFPFSHSCEWENYLHDPFKKSFSFRKSKSQCHICLRILFCFAFRQFFNVKKLLRIPHVHLRWLDVDALAKISQKNNFFLFHVSHLSLRQKKEKKIEEKFEF